MVVLIIILLVHINDKQRDIPI